MGMMLGTRKDLMRSRVSKFPRLAVRLRPASAVLLAGSCGLILYSRRVRALDQSLVPPGCRAKRAHALRPEFAFRVLRLHRQEAARPSSAERERVSSSHVVCPVGL